MTGSDSEDEFVRGGRNDEPRPKRPKHERKARVPLLASGVHLPDSPEGSTKSSEDESKRRRGHSNSKFTGRDLSKYMNDESRWFEAISKRCEDLEKLHKEQARCIRSLETIDFECSRIIVELSADSLQRSKRIQIAKQLGDVENKRREKSAELRQTTFSATREGTLIKQNLASWYAKEQKATERIEKSR